MGDCDLCDPQGGVIVFALVDCNSFYASCERRFRPDLHHRPIVVLSNNDGCIIARCSLAKSLDIPMGVSYFKVRGLLEHHQVAVFSSNYPLYGDMSRRVMQTLGRFSPQVEVYSIDEAFINLQGLPLNDLGEYGHIIRQKIQRNIGLPTCVGIGPSKVLAKAANHIAKKFPDRTQGVWVLDHEGAIEKCLQWLPIEDVWGIGRRHADRLRGIGVHTAAQFVQLPPLFVRDMMTVVGQRIQMELQGVSCLPLSEVLLNQRSICTSRSFGKRIQSYPPLESAVSMFANRSAHKLRMRALCARCISVFVYAQPLGADLPMQNYSRQRVLIVPSSDSFEIVHLALELLQEMWFEGFRYKKAGVIVSDTIPQDQVQGNLFDHVDRDQSLKSMQVIDQVNLKYGRDTLQLGIIQGNKDWHLRCEHHSPCYTTRWDQLMEIRL